MFYTLFFVAFSLFSFDYGYLEMGYIDRDKYECFFEDDFPSIQKSIEYKTHPYGSIYKITVSTGAIQSQFKLSLRDFQYDDSISDIDGFVHDYSTTFRTEKNPDLRIKYTQYRETMHARLVRFYSLIGIKQTESNNEVFKIHHYGFVPFNKQLESVIDAAKWDSGSLAQLKIMMAVFLDDPKNIVFSSMIKNSLLPIDVPTMDGDNFPKKPKKDQKTDILCSNYPHALGLFQLGKMLYPVKFVSLNSWCMLADKNTGFALPSEDTWIALSPQASEIVTFDRKNHALISMGNVQEKGEKKRIVLCVSPENLHIQHGIFLNKDLLVLATLSQNKIHNIVYDRTQNKFWILPATIRFQHFLVADESLFKGHYVIGGFSAVDPRYQRWISQTKIPKKQSFSCAADAFSMQQFSLDDAEEITLADLLK
jgi:hypothetical protein